MSTSAQEPITQPATEEATTTVEEVLEAVPVSSAVVRHAGDTNAIAAFASEGHFESAQRIARALAASSLVPKEYQGKLANCLVAMELASRTGASVLMVMQNLHIIQGRPSWSAAFLIASINGSGRFTPIRYEFEGTASQNGWRCRAVARDRQSGDRLEGEWITWEMVAAEGWLSKAGSKWKTMPGQMMRYRAASFWARAYAPEISLGMRTSDEEIDIDDPRDDRASGGAAELETALRSQSSPAKAAPAAEKPESSVSQEAGPAAAAGQSTPKRAPASAKLAPFPCTDCGAQTIPHRPGCKAQA